VAVVHGPDLRAGTVCDLDERRRTGATETKSETTCGESTSPAWKAAADARPGARRAGRGRWDVPRVTVVDRPVWHAGGTRWSHEGPGLG